MENAHDINHFILGCGDKEIEPSAEPSQDPIPEDTSTTSDPVEEPLCEAIDLSVELPITAEGSTEDGYDFLCQRAVKEIQAARQISHFSGKFRQMVSIVFTHLILVLIRS